MELLRLGSQLSDAEFREDQERAIRHLIHEPCRLLLVQKTGWGKSFVYFIAETIARVKQRSRVAYLAAPCADAQPDLSGGADGGHGPRVPAVYHVREVSAYIAL